MNEPGESTCRIERAVAQDAAAILALQKLAYRSEARLYDDADLPPLRQTESALRQEIETTCVLKALAGTQLVGSVRAHEEEGVCRIGRLIVRPELQRRGIGSLLMRAVEAAFPAAKCYELFTGHRSEGNLRLYERLGYRRTVERVLSPTVTLVFMEKTR